MVRQNFLAIVRRDEAPGAASSLTYSTREPVAVGQGAPGAAG